MLARHAGGYHRVHVGDRFKGGTYTVLRKLGWGHFSTVWLVVNNETGSYGAMKVRAGCLPLAAALTTRGAYR